ncbi:hypothetical protein VT50_0208470 [Streptomyces antioxidans]|uniref:DUF4232 domain-containing protein n=1 Tax=Streptomyces antioxidans TaxID=1507734 RepID=A0A1V4D9F5_9ACTN|nr:DUF4232 domain-containing protein [Streptomyces antioxidans]OPF82153.1 hypothetical protein VT50_0208470 [Streptomyces antioxidans]
MNVTAYRRGRTVRSIAATIVAAAALSLTAACGGGGDGGSDHADKANSSATAPASSTDGQGAGKSEAGKGNQAAKGSGKENQADEGKQGGKEGAAGAEDAKSQTSQTQKSGGGSEAEPVGDCDINKTAITVQHVKNPINHMLLKVTNKAGVDCKLVGYPGLKFGADAQAATPVNEDSKPQAVVMLAPGESAYAGITTSAADGSGAEGGKVDSLEVFIDGNEDPKPVALPGGSVYVDSGSQVTYWQTDAQTALTW